jgi:hemoglobin/transferrin/lactoferrin receptor protein
MNNKYILLCASLLFAMVTAKSQSIETSSDSIALHEIVVSANKTAQPIYKVAQQIKVLTSPQIFSQQAQTTADLLQATGSAFVQKSQQGGGSPVLRGFEANKVVIMIDGVRMNNAIYRGGHLQNVITLDNNALDRLEVLYGPSSTIYGSDALGGVLHFYTKKAVLSANENTLFKGAAMVRYGTVNNEKTANVNFNIGGKNLASFTSITASSFDDLVMGKRVNPSLGAAIGERINYVERINGKDSLVVNTNKYKQVSTGYDQLDIVQKFAHKLSDKLTQGINFQLSTSTDIPRYDRLTDPNAKTILNQAEWYYGPQKRTMIAYDLNSNADTSETNFHIGVNYQAIEESRVSRGFNSSKKTSRIEKLNILGLSIDFNKKKGIHHIRYGVDAQINDLKSTAFITNVVDKTESAQSTRYPDGKNKFNQAGVYFSHTADLSERVVLNDGIRVGLTTLHSTFISKQFFPFPFEEAKQNNFTYSGNIGINYLFGQKSKISGNISSGFRAPNIDDLAKVFESSATLIVPNTDLKPEQTLNIELASIIGFGNKSVFQIALFNTQLYNAIVVDKFTFNGASEIEYNGKKVPVVAAQNKNKASISGFTTSINTPIVSNLYFDASAMYTVGKIKDEKDTPLDHIPPLVLRSGLAYGRESYTLGLSILYNGWKRIADFNPGGEDNQQYAPKEGMPSWYTLNFKGSYRLNNTVSLLGGIDNIMDLQYRTFSSGINGAGRNFYFTLKASF